MTLIQFGAHTWNTILVWALFVYDESLLDSFYVTLVESITKYKQVNLSFEDDHLNICRSITYEEMQMHIVLESFSRDKCPGLDRWSVELFLHFMDIMGLDLLQMVEESRTLCKTLGAINSTFIALMLKATKAESFADYMPIFLCNSIYKMISKIIATHIKSILSKFISFEQFGFLEHRRI